MKIKVITTIDFEGSIKIGDDLSKVYDIFKEIIANCYESQDLTDFMFVNCDTNTEIENEVD